MHIGHRVGSERHAVWVVGRGACHAVDWSERWRLHAHDLILSEVAGGELLEWQQGQWQTREAARH